MEIQIKETIFVKSKDTHVVQAGTHGYDKDRVIYFPDTTKTVFVGFQRDTCINNPQMFSVSRNISDREVSIKDVLAVISGLDVPQETKEELQIKIQTL